MTTEVNLVHHGHLAVASQGRAEKVHHLVIVHLARVGNQAHPMDGDLDGNQLDLKMMDTNRVRAEKVAHHLVNLASLEDPQAHPMDWILDHGAQVQVESQARVEVAQAVVVQRQVLHKSAVDSAFK